MQQNKQERKNKKLELEVEADEFQTSSLQRSSWIQASHWRRSSAATTQSSAAAAAAEPRPGPSLKGHRLEISVECRERGGRRKTSWSLSYGSTSRKSESTLPTDCVDPWSPPSVSYRL